MSLFCGLPTPTPPAAWRTAGVAQSLTCEAPEDLRWTSGMGVFVLVWPIEFSRAFGGMGMRGVELKLLAFRLTDVSVLATVLPAFNLGLTVALGLSAGGGGVLSVGGGRVTFAFLQLLQGVSLRLLAQRVWHGR